MGSRSCAHAPRHGDRVVRQTDGRKDFIMEFPSALSLISLVFATCTLFLLEHFDFWTGFLSHPFWSQKANWMGIGIGAGSGLVLHAMAGNQKRCLLYAMLCFAVSGLGLFIFTSMSKEAFAASYAENRLAGQLWFYGFIAYIGALFLLLSFALTFVLHEEKK